MLAAVQGPSIGTGSGGGGCLSCPPQAPIPQPGQLVASACSPDTQTQGPAPVRG